MKSIKTTKKELHKYYAAMWISILATLVIIAVIAFSFVDFSFLGNDVDEVSTDETAHLGETDEKGTVDADGAETTFAESTTQTEDFVKENETDSGEKIKLIAGITVEEILSVSGSYPEDGSAEQIDNVLAVKINNTTGRTLEVISFKLITEGEEYNFSVSMLKGGKSLTVLNLEKNRFPEEIGDVEFDVSYYLFCEKEPDLEENKFDVQIMDGAIKVTNISGNDIDKEVVVYYKNLDNGIYYGGITYRVRITDGIKAGEGLIVTASNSKKDKTEIIKIEEIKNKETDYE